MVYNRPEDPTPEEIAAACERIRQSWSPAEREQRRTHFASGKGHYARSSAELCERHWQPPIVAERDLPLAPTIDLLAC